MTHPGSRRGGSARYRIGHVSRFGIRCSGPSMHHVAVPSTPRIPSQRLLDFSLKTTPRARFTTETDPFGNIRHVLTLHRDHTSLEVISNSTVEVDPPPALPERLGLGAWDEVRSMGDNPRWWDFTRPSPVARPSHALAEFVPQIGVVPDIDPLVDVLALSSALNDAFAYAPGATSVDSPIDDILASRKGVCQDYTHVLVAIARSWGIPTRYVSGYLYVTDHEEGEPTSAFGAATHAWAESRLPGVGWIGIDPTNRTVADQKYVRIAVGRDYRDVPPPEESSKGAETPTSRST